MKHLIRLQQALESRNVVDVQVELRLLEEQASAAWKANMLQEAGRRYGFPTIMLDGVCYMLARDLGLVFYGNVESAAPIHLLRRNGLNTIEIGGFVHNVRTLIRQHFGLSNHASVKLATWTHFLVVGMNGETEVAQDVRNYILTTEDEFGTQKMMEEAGLVQQSFSLAQLVDVATSAATTAMAQSIPKIVQQVADVFDKRFAAIEKKVSNTAKDMQAESSFVLLRVYDSRFDTSKALCDKAELWLVRRAIQLHVGDREFRRHVFRPQGRRIIKFSREFLDAHIADLLKYIENDHGPLFGDIYPDDFRS